MVQLYFVILIFVNCGLLSCADNEIFDDVVSFSKLYSNLIDVLSGSEPEIDQILNTVHLDVNRNKTIGDLNDVNVTAVSKYFESRGITAACSIDLAYYTDAVLNYGTMTAELGSCAGNQTCTDLLNQKRNGYAWIFQFIDASAKMPPGILGGSYKWDGSYDVCDSISLANPYQPETGYELEGSYCSLRRPLKITSLNDDVAQIVTLDIDLCVPRSCSADDVVTLASIVSKKLTFSNVVCDEEIEQFKITPKIISFLIIVSCFLLFVIYGTLTDNAQSSSHTGGQRLHKIHSDRFTKFTHVFSLVRNVSKILSFKKAQGHIICLNGLRFFSMIWIILGETAKKSMEGGNSVVAFKSFGSNVFNMFIINCSLGIDTFLVISGFLVSLLWFREMDATRGRKFTSTKFWGSYYIHRYIRLTPLYAMVIWATVSIYPYLIQGPFKYDFVESHVNPCGRNWWTNLLYINNLYHPFDQCHDSSWYLALDMQLYILAPVIMILIYGLKSIGLMYSLLAIVSFICTSCLVTFQHSYSPGYFPTLNERSISSDYFTNVFITPWMRYCPYLIGILAGYLLSRLEKLRRPMRFPTALVVLCWFLTLAVLGAVLYGPHNYVTGDSNHYAWAIYGGLSQTAWSLCVGFIILACHMGYGGILNKLLSWKMWNPFGRLTYAAFLIHNDVIAFYFGQKLRNWIYDNLFNLSVTVAGLIVTTYVIAFFLSLIIEVPFANIEKMIFSYRSIPVLTSVDADLSVDHHDIVQTSMDLELQVVMNPVNTNVKTVKSAIEVRHYPTVGPSKTHTVSEGGPAGWRLRRWSEQHNNQNGFLKNDFNEDGIAKFAPTLTQAHAVIEY